jgi:hypothetical protein
MLPGFLIPLMAWTLARFSNEKLLALVEPLSSFANSVLAHAEVATAITRRIAVPRIINHPTKTPFAWDRRTPTLGCP